MWSSTSLYEKHDVEQYLCMRKICKVIWFVPMHFAYPIYF
jgi:hypothetical protein